MWFRKKHGLYKSLKKIWAHEGPCTKRKNDEHMKAHVKKSRRDSHVLEIKIRERSLMLRSIV